MSVDAGVTGLRALFHPRSIALVGATDKSGWSRGTYDNLRSHGFGGDVYLVTHRGGRVHGARAYSRLGDIPGPVDLAYVMVPPQAVLPVLREGADLGIQAYVVLTAGFAEIGGDGVRREKEIAEFALSRGLSILGPNGNGYINATVGIMPYGLPIPVPLLRGPVGVVLQSGALASAVLTFTQARNVGISLLASMGNESVVSVADVVEHLVDDPATKAIALFLESVRQPEKFARVARRALRAGKPIVALKVGRSDHARRTAEAHTGALTGNDAVSDAVFRQLGVVRVRSLEDLIITAALLAQGPLPDGLRGPRLGVVTPSGGASEIIADRAQDEGLRLPAFAPETAAALAGILPAFATVANPLDVTGYVLIDRTLLGRALEIVAADPGVDTVVLLSELPRAEPADPDAIRAVYAATSGRVAASPRPVVVVSNTLTDVTAYGREFQAATGYPCVTGGIEHGMHAIGAAVRWSQARRDALARAAAGEQEPGSPASGPGGSRPSRALRAGPVARVPAQPAGVWAEDRAAALLAARGVPVVPTRTAASPAAAVHAAEVLGYPVVLKAVSPGAAHKSDIGAVRLALPDAAAVRAAFQDVRAAARRATADPARVAGTADGQPRIIVQPYRTGGIELIAGVVRDPAWGLVLAVGLGGVWVEALGDTALRVLPTSADEIGRALGELRGAAVLRGGHGTEPADLGRVADVIARIADLAIKLGGRLESLEVNPLYVHGPQVEALDALITWRAQAPAGVV
jgi:acetate---CoA ligase (ADP-forming)